MANLTFQWEGDINVVGGEVKKDGVPISAGSSGAVIEDIKGNYIDNSNFSANSNEQSEYTTEQGTNLYTVDRWYIDGGTLVPKSNGVQFTNNNENTGTNSLIRLRQDIPYPFDTFAGKKLTLSAKINGVIYTGTSEQLPAEKPTEGTDGSSAIQYIQTTGIAEHAICLNYSVTGDYFVPYIALAYSQSAEIEWVKLEIGDSATPYVAPDYATEKIKTGLMSDNGNISLPYTKEEVDNRFSAAGTINVKTGRFQIEPGGNMLHTITYPPRFTEGRCFLFDNNYYGIEEYKVTKVSDIYNSVEPAEIDAYNTNVIAWQHQGTFFDFIIQKDERTGRNLYHFFKNENLSGGEISHYIHQTDGDVFEEYSRLIQTGGSPIYPMQKEARKINKIINLSSGLYLFCEENERIAIYTNNSSVANTDKTQFGEIFPAGNRLLHTNYEFWSQGNFVFIKDNDANRVDIWDTLANEMFGPMIKDTQGELLNLDLQYITYFPVAKVFIGYSAMEDLLYYCKNDGIGDLSDWQYTRNLGFASGQYYFNTTENYLFIPQETEIGVFNKDFEKVAINPNIAVFNNVFETNQGIVACDNTMAFGYNFEKKEVSIEDAINSLI